MSKLSLVEMGGILDQAFGDEGWIILRTSGSNTLKLVEHLSTGGCEVWAPTRTVVKRSPRRKSSRDVTAAILPSFVFARARHVHALLILAESPSRSCPSFSVFRQNGSVPVISTTELSPLRFIEKAEADRLKRQRMKGKVAAFPSGSIIRMSGGSFAGLSGVVESDDGRFAEISFGSFKVKISTFLLRNDMAQHGDIAA